MELSFNESTNSWEMRIVAEEDQSSKDELLLSEETPTIKRKSSAPTPSLSPTSKLDVFQKCTTTPASRSPSRRSLMANMESETSKQYLHVGNTNSIFRLPKPQVKMLKKTASVKQLYNSVLHAIRTIASSRDDIVPDLTKTFFESILRESEDSPKLQVTKVKVKDGKEMGRHFCSQIHAVEVTAKIKDTKGSSSTKLYHLIVKSQPQNEDARQFLQPSHTFEKEVQMYGQVFHDMANYVRKESIVSLSCKDSEVMDIPRCFYTKWAGDDNVKEDLIILENLYPQGFTFAINQDNGLDRQHAELVIRELAKFHAISYCMKEGDNDKILTKYNYLAEDSLYRNDTIGFTKRTIMPVMASLAELIRNSPEYEHNYEWFVELARNFHAIQMEMVKPTNDFAVICHGDLWLSNILFRYESDKEKNHPLEVKFIDFQSSRFSSLATDLLIFFFTSLETQLRREMMGELLSLYYTTFLVSVRSLNVMEEIFSLEELLEEVEEHILYGFLEGIWYLDIVHNGHVPKTTETESCSDLTKLESIDQCESDEQKSYKADFVELLEEVLFLLAKGENHDPRRHSLRDTSLRFEERRNSRSSSNNSPLL